MEKSVEAGARLAWIDLARGICIILVVAMHFDEVYFSQLTLPDLVKTASDAITSAARPARMPTFFFISGFLASGALWRSWPSIFNSRIVVLYWTYAVWSSIAVAVMYVLYEPLTMETIQRLADRVFRQLIFPQTSTWFLYGLVVFFAFARLYRKIPLFTIVLAFATSAFSANVSNMVLSELIRTLPFFLLGIYFPHLALRSVRDASWTRLCALLVCYALVTTPLLFVGHLPGIWLPASAVGVMLILTAARMLAQMKGSGIMCYIGKNTLPIYVLHIPVLLIFKEATNNFVEFDLFGALVVAAGAISMLIIFCLVFAAQLKRLGLGWLFEPPVHVHFSVPPSRSASASAAA